MSKMSEMDIDRQDRLLFLYNARTRLTIFCSMSYNKSHVWQPVCAIEYDAMSREIDALTIGVVDTYV